MSKFKTVITEEEVRQVCDDHNYIFDDFITGYIQYRFTRRLNRMGEKSTKYEVIEDLMWDYFQSIN